MVVQVGCGTSLDFSNDIPPNVMKLYKYSLNDETIFPSVLPYLFGYVMKSALQMTSVTRMSIVVEGWVKCTYYIRFDPRFQQSEITLEILVRKRQKRAGDH